MLNVAPNLERADEFYEALIEAHRGLTEAQSAMVNAKLVLLLANQVGEFATLTAAIEAARDWGVSFHI